MLKRRSAYINAFIHVMCIYLSMNGIVVVQFKNTIFDV